MLKSEKCIPGWAVDGGAALHFCNGEYFKSIQFYRGSFVYYISTEKERVIENKMEMTIL